MLETVRSIVAASDVWTEIRFHQRQLLAVEIRNGTVKKAEHKTLAGAGIRALVDGCWGFVSTTDTSGEGLKKAVREAKKAAGEAAGMRKKKIAGLGKSKVGKGSFYYTDLSRPEPTTKEKIEAVMQAEAKIRAAGDDIEGSIAGYTELRDCKIIVNTNGAACETHDLKCSIVLAAIAVEKERREIAYTTNGVTGNWDDLFKEKSLEELVMKAVTVVRQKLKAAYAPGGQYTVILAPPIVGIMAHEAIGHTVEADIVESGSIVKGKIGEKVASELITMVDDGAYKGAGGMVLVDDEGTLGQRTVIIEEGMLKEYLHNLESAYSFVAEPRGNARAFTYRDEPIIRMTNTFILPGRDRLADMVKGVKEGFFLVDVGQGGQADVTAEFMFGVQEAYWIRDGEIQEPVKGITISGQAFEVLKSVDAVSTDFAFGLGTGFCGKGQPAKVDAGGPYLRCRVTIGGQVQKEG